MNNLELLTGGMKLLVCGMGMVFFFLVVMIVCMMLMQRFLAPFADRFEPAPKKAAPKAVPTDDGADALIAAAAVAAVARERR